MVFCLAQICCSPHSADNYAIPTSLHLIKLFANEQEAAELWPQDVVHAPAPELEGQQVYQVLWNTDEGLNLDRFIDNRNVISNVGSWLPESKQIVSDVTGVNFELLTPERVKEKMMKRRTLEVKSGARGRTGARVVAKVLPSTASRQAQPQQPTISTSQRANYNEPEHRTTPEPHRPGGAHEPVENNPAGLYRHAYNDNRGSKGRSWRSGL